MPITEPLTLAPDLRKELEKFLASPARNQWIQTSQLEVYVRKGHHMVNRHMYQFLDLANITIKKPFRHRGLFKQVLNLFKQMGIAQDGVYVESVMNPMLAVYLESLSKNDPDSYWNSATQCFAWIRRR